MLRTIATTLCKNRSRVVLVLLQFVCIFGIDAMAARARNDQTAAATSLTQPVSTSAPKAPAQTEMPPLSSPPMLSPEAERVGQIALQNGDQQFLMVDKARGEIILFESGKPIFSGPALTGAGLGDRVPPVVLTFSGLHPLTLEQKVTPSGRFTVTTELDPDYGRVWNLNEIHGKDWDFAIHQVFLGIASEHRDARFHSANAADRHITWGCINVEHSTIQTLWQHLLHKDKIPLYILPNDERLVPALFPLKHPSSVTKSVTAAEVNDHTH
ncbi:MAG TPA: L,D-transpeptidase [Acetobacteraceae bacterium]|jgi:hypothetical protein|nr:L,D-transpeptidase [Acetobacteraceae bacterium]